MVYSELVKGIAVLLMRFWRNSSSVSRELIIHHKTIFSGGGGCDEATVNGLGVVSAVDDQGKQRTRPNRLQKNRFDFVPKLNVTLNFDLGVNCNVRTAYRRLSKAGIRSCCLTVRIPLTP